MCVHAHNHVCACTHVCKEKTSKVKPIQIRKEILTKMKVSNPAALLVLIKNKGKQVNYINDAVNTPTKKEALLEYVSHSFIGNEWLGYIETWLHYSLWTHKEQPAFHDFYLSQKSTYLQPNYTQKDVPKSGLLKELTQQSPKEMIWKQLSPNI